MYLKEVPVAVQDCRLRTVSDIDFCLHSQILEADLNRGWTNSMPVEAPRSRGKVWHNVKRHCSLPSVAFSDTKSVYRLEFLHAGCNG